MTSYVESAAKPRDLQRDLAMAAQQNLTKRKSIADHMQMAIPGADTSTGQPDQEAGTKRARLSVPQRQAVINTAGRHNHIHKPVRASDTPAGRVALQDRYASISNDLQGDIKDLRDEVELSGQAIVELKQKLELSRQDNMELKDKLARATKACEDRGRRSHTATELWQGEKKTYEARVAQLKAELHAATQGARDAEQRAQHLQQEQADWEQRARAAEGALDSSDADNMQRQLELEQMVEELHAELEATRNEAQDAAEVAQRQLAADQSQLADAQAQLKEQSQRLAAAISAGETAASQRRQAELAAAEARRDANQAVADLALARASGEAGDSSALLRQLRAEVDSQQDELSEARRLKAYVKNVEVLQEQLHAAQQQAQQAQAAQKEVQQQLEELQLRQQQHRDWHALLQKAPGVSTPEELLHQLTQLQREAASATSALGNRNTEIRELQGKVSLLEQQKQQAEAAARAASPTMATAAAQHARLERKIALLTKERNGLKQILQSYEEEDMAAVRDPVAAAQLTGATPQRAAQAERISQLENSLTEVQQQLQQVEATVSQHEAAAAEAAADAGRQGRRAAAAESEAKRLNGELECLSRQLQMLEERLGRGEFDKAKTRVVHFVNNPETLAHRTMQSAREDGLQAENDALKEQLRLLEQRAAASGDGSTPDAAGSEAAAVAAAQITILTGKVAQLEKRLARLTQVFNRQIATFREACYCMFGYRIDMKSEAAPISLSSGVPPSLFVLRPRNADDARAELLFRMNPDSTMELLPSEWTTNSQAVKEQVDMFIGRFNSIPALTAQVTMDLFQRQTQC